MQLALPTSASNAVGAGGSTASTPTTATSAGGVAISARSAVTTARGGTAGSSVVAANFDLKKTSEELFKMCKSGKVQGLKDMLAAVPAEHLKDLAKATDANGNTALCSVTQPAMVAMLVEAGWYTESTNAQRHTPLYIACAGGEKTKAIARALIFAGANFEARNLEKQTCLDACTNANTRKELRRYINQAENERVIKSLTPTELVHFQTMFDVIDVERAGRVTVDAVRTLMGLAAATDKSVSDTVMSSFFDWWDFDQDGLMEFGDFVRVSRQLEEGLPGVDDMMSIAGHSRAQVASGTKGNRGGTAGASAGAGAGASSSSSSSSLFLAVPGGSGASSGLALLSPMTKLLNGVPIDQVRNDLQANSGVADEEDDNGDDDNAGGASGRKGNVKGGGSKKATAGGAASASSAEASTAENEETETIEGAE